MGFLGNSARKFFKNAKEVSEILGIPEYFIVDIGHIWIALVSGLPIDAEKFGNFCDEFIQKFKNDPSINFYQFSPTLHKGCLIKKNRTHRKMYYLLGYHMTGY